MASYQPSILVVESDDLLRQELSRELLANDFRVIEANCMTSAQREALSACPDLVIVGSRLSDGGAADVARKLIGGGVLSRVLVMHTVGDIVTLDECYNAGVRNFMRLPHTSEELLAHIRGLVYVQSQTRMLQRAGLALDLRTRVVICGGRSVRLADSAFRLLWTLLAHIEQPVSHQAILRDGSDGERNASRNVVHRHAAEARAALTAVGSPLAIVSVRGGFVITRTVARIVCE